MYGEKSIRLTKEEYNYLLPVLRKKLLHTEGGYFFIGTIECITDMLDRLKGLYNYYDSIKSMLVYRCSKFRSIEEFRELVNLC